MKRAHLIWLVLVSAGGAAEVLHPGNVIKTMGLDETRPYFVATHPRVTTTVRFPRAIEPPEGAAGLFAEDARASGAEYIISWQPGDAFFTLIPGRDAKLANLNVPFEGRTYVFYFYPVTEALKAVAAVNLGGAGDQRLHEPYLAASDTPAPDPAVTRTTERPKRSLPEPTANRWLGLMDRLKLIHATAEGPQLVALAKAMGVEVAVCGQATPAAPTRLSVPVTDSGWYQLVLLRVVRDPRLNAVGFVALLRNLSRETLVFDPASFGVRVGTGYYPQRISDAPAVLTPGAQSPIYFVIQAGPSTPLGVANSWRLSVDLLSPAMNPGAALLQEFVQQRRP